MKTKFLVASAAAALTVGLAGQASAMVSVGDTLSMTYNFPDAGSVYTGPFTATFTGTASLPIDPGFVIGYANFLANSVDLSQSNYGCCYTASSFNGVEISDLTNPSAFAGWTVLSNSFGPVTEYQSGGTIYVNWAGDNAGGGDIVIGTTVPEPAAWAMMLVGFGGLGVAMRSRRRATTAVA